MIEIHSHFKEVDPVISELIVKYPKINWMDSQQHDYFRDLCRMIVGQQLSTKAAATIFGRFESHFEGKVSPTQLSITQDDILRNIGLSRAKIIYVKDLANKIIHHELNIEQLPSLSDSEVITSLTKVKGIGQWTAEMFLIFSLNRPDVFSIGDLGLKRAMEKNYSPDITDAQRLQISQKWSPFRSYACRLLWESLDNNPQI